MTRYSTESRTRKYVKGYGFLSFSRNLSNKYGKKLLDTAKNTGLDATKTSSKKSSPYDSRDNRIIDSKYNR